MSLLVVCMCLHGRLIRLIGFDMKSVNNNNNNYYYYYVLFCYKVHHTHNDLWVGIATPCVTDIRTSCLPAERSPLFSAHLLLGCLTKHISGLVLFELKDTCYLDKPTSRHVKDVLNQLAFQNLMFYPTKPPGLLACEV